MLTEDQINEAALKIFSEVGVQSTVQAVTPLIEDENAVLKLKYSLEAVKAMGVWVQEETAPRWVPISEYPEHEILKVSRWHKLWKCLVSVEHRRAYAENGCEWLSGTKDNTWPEEAFEPFFMLLPTSPVPYGK